jgi:hypothetical protein
MVGWQLLMLVRQFWTEERMIRTWSQDGKIEVTRFRGADLPNQLDVQVSAESMLPKSKSARAQLALDLWDRQIIRDPAQFIRMVEIPGVGFLQDDFDRDVRQAEREYGRMVTGEMVQAEDWHNHAVHINQHNNDRKTEEWEAIEAKARAGDPMAAQVVATVEKHNKQHYEWMAYQQSGILPPDFAGGTPGPFGQGPAGRHARRRRPALPRPHDRPAAGPARRGRRPGAVGPFSMNPPSGITPIGGPGQMGPVPGQTADSQAAHTGN